ncbi:hypothetical protein [Desulfogranum marinum]|uniref:hypothetical protein n=1 Tax=Desulfogranum marinum TaxID=453220 RepID=UPI001E57C400|nr:hypothetical protein [Desulfogranum marinum]
MDRILKSMINRLGYLKKAFLIDDYAKGKDSGIIDLVLVGNIDQYHLNDLTQKTEMYIKKKKIGSLVLSEKEVQSLKSTLSDPARCFCGIVQKMAPDYTLKLKETIYAPESVIENPCTLVSLMVTDLFNSLEFA